MRLIDHFPVTAKRSRGAHFNDGPKSTTQQEQAPSWPRIALVVGAVALTLLAFASMAHADTMNVALAKSVDEVLTNIRNWIMGILALLATVFLSIGGARWIMGGNDPGEVEKAKSAFRSAGWGYGLAALAPLVVEILKGIVSA